MAVAKSRAAASVARAQVLDVRDAHDGQRIAGRRCAGTRFATPRRAAVAGPAPEVLAVVLDVTQRREVAPGEPHRPRRGRPPGAGRPPRVRAAGPGRRSWNRARGRGTWPAARPRARPAAR